MLSACAPQQSTVQMGAGNNLVSGSAGGSASVDANKSLIRCAKPLGTLAVDDGRYQGTQGVTTVDPLLRLAVQQSNCFVITGIGNRRTSDLLDRITREQRESGEYRANSKQHKGQRVAADYLLDPQVVVGNETTAGDSMSAGGGLLGAIGTAAGGPLVGALAGAVSKASETKTTIVALTLTDIRTTVQIGISEGSSTTTNLGSSFGGWGGLLGVGGAGAMGAGMGSFTRTPEGQSIAAAFFDAYNGMVQSLKNYKAQEVEGGLGAGGTLKVGD
ncbi:hypothetical protein VZ94_02780 [Methylocucumis oryzae]|uniref:Curli production assembly/transport component CsgG n=1 Tax=Methylocucumis oryzae TaxID=1632867 RepID=A0A0F3IMJ1_9GAMM|nr:hypothetical protein VZ94_02780 [Methylocucumis oryzae]